MVCFVLLISKFWYRKPYAYFLKFLKILRSIFGHYNLGTNNVKIIHNEIFKYYRNLPRPILVEYCIIFLLILLCNILKKIFLIFYRIFLLYCFNILENIWKNIFIIYYEHWKMREISLKYLFSENVFFFLTTSYCVGSQILVINFWINLHSL